jgi:hypothetical protein
MLTGHKPMLNSGKLLLNNEKPMLIFLKSHLPFIFIAFLTQKTGFVIRQQLIFLNALSVLVVEFATLITFERS